jgi:hypothetical protein
VGDDRRQVEPGGDKIEVVLHGVLGHPADLLDAEPVRTDHMQFLEVQRCPLEAPGRLDPGDHQRAAGGQQAQ